MSTAEKIMVTHGFIEIYRKRSKTTSRNEFPLTVCFADNNDAWPERSLRHKGYTVFVARRPYVKSELGDEKGWRYYMVRYKNAEGLIRDEWNITKDKEWCQDLVNKLNCSANLEQILELGD